MCAEIVKLPQVPRPTIEQALEEFLAEQRASLKPRTMAKYEETIELLRHYLNRYAVGALPKKERASRILYEALRYKVRFHYPYEEDYLDFDCFAIDRIERGKLWLKPLQEGWGKKTLGPIIVPKEATELLEEGWSIECALERFRGQWRILDVGNVLPI